MCQTEDKVSLSLMFGIYARKQNPLLVLLGKTQNCIKIVRGEVRKTS